MTLTPGTRLGPYEVVAPLGAGGMGEVFKGRDTRLERSVAIKVLPADFANNAQLKLRFEREAKAISQLSHPNICTLYDVGDGYLVMELLEGETLADRIARGPLPLDQIIRIGTEIANALDRAHKAGIIHRDLKPGNVMLTKSGAKLLDFGLAKSGGQLPSPVLSGMTVQKPLTEEGTLLGTFQYMAPEQIEGAEADARTDIFALGAVLYEMATGKPAFDGRSKASLIAAILAAEPKPISAVAPMTPASFDRVVRKCLEKDPDERWQSAHDVGTELRWLAEAPDAQPRAAKHSWLPWVAAAVVVALAVGGMLAYHTMVQRNAPIVRTAILAPDNTAFSFANAGAPPAISPDGTKIVFGAAEAGKPRTLWIRSLDSFAAQQLAGTEGAIFPFWSSDGRYVGFFADNALKKVEVGGGAPVVLCTVPDGRGGSWSPDGQTIIFAGRYTPIYRVPAAGGTAVAVTKVTSDFSTHRFPEFLPDGRHFLFLASPNGNADPANAICLSATDGSVQKPLITNAVEPHYFHGCILFVRDQILTAQPFDPKRLAISGDALPLKEQRIECARIFSRSMVTVAPNGTLVYQTGAATTATILGWFDRTGKPLGSLGDPAPFNWTALAPDGHRAVVSYVASPQSNLWLYDLARNVRTRVTFNPGLDTAPVWAPDGTKLVYTTMSTGRFRIVLHDLTTSAEEQLLDGPAFGIPMVTSWSPDGQRLLYQIAGRDTRADIYWMSLADRKPHVYLKTPFVEGGARFSPDGKWVAYQSDETGMNEIYVAPFPPTGAKWQVSSGGGAVARWRGDGKEIFYIVPRSPSVTVVPFTAANPPQIGQPQKLFEFRLGAPGLGMYDTTADGQRFLVNIRSGEEPPPAPLLVVQHFDRELRAALEHRD